MTGFAMLLLLAHLGSHWFLYAFVVIYGFAQGAGGIAVAAKTVALFQGPYLGRMFMLVTLSANLGAAFGAWCGGQLFDLSGSYTLTFLLAIISGVVAITCMRTGNTRRQPILRPS
jgi:predicted MFS family arabinose efflux permease